MKRYCYYNSPIGKLLLTGTDGILEELYFPNSQEKNHIPDEWQYDEASFKEVLQQLAEYFTGERRDFDLRISPKGTDFQKRVWQELQKIPFGQTACYGDIAERIGNPKASRAVGMANSKNPLPIIVPCHRVIGKDGSLTGFAGGMDIKQQLLELENIVYAKS